MELFKIAWAQHWTQPQLFSLIFTVLIIFALAITVYVMIKKTSRPDKAPNGFLLVLEGYVNFIDDLYETSTDGKLKPGKVYIFGLFTFLLIGNLIGLLGIDAIATSYSVTLSISLITFLGSYGIGLWWQKIRFFKRYLNPVEIVGQFAPLISISFRIYGNITGGGTIVFLIYLFFGYIWHLIPGLGGHYFPFMAALFTPFLHMYFDIFGALIQALIFASLTTCYWSQQAVLEEKKNKKKAQDIDALKNNNDNQVKVVNTNASTY